MFSLSENPKRDICHASITAGSGRAGSGRFIFLIDLKLKNKIKCVDKIVPGALLKIQCGFLDLPYTDREARIRSQLETSI